MLVSIGILIGMKVNTAVSGDDLLGDVRKFNEALDLVQKITWRKSVLIN